MKIINDTIHGQINMSSTAIKIIDTPEFQRLRDIKQLGACNYVFPTATHSRFEHSIGVAHLGKEFLNRLVINSWGDKQPLKVEENDYLMVELAGLCHDLGHGPFSHLFDYDFLNKTKTGGESSSDDELMNSQIYSTHENRSCLLLRHINNKYNIGLMDEQLNIICDMIKPSGENKSFLYSIISNQLNSLDVDKIDYIQRDIYMVGLEYGFKHHRIFTMAKVIDNEICYHKKEAFNINEFFRLRYNLHKQVYNHSVVRAYELMICDILHIMDPYINISTSITNPEEFIKITDSILYTIPFLPECDVTGKAIELLNRMKIRDIYKCIDEINIYDRELYENCKTNLLMGLNSNDILNLSEYLIIDEIKIGLTGGTKHPIEDIRFYDSGNDNIRINPQELSIFKNALNNEHIVRFYVKDMRYYDDIEPYIDRFKNEFMSKNNYVYL
jgi:deoxynucleoside triphosphate triphosphohydrolase SAMHD1